MALTRYFALLLLVTGVATTAHAQDSTRDAPRVAQPAPARLAYLRASLGTTYSLSWEYRCARLGLEYAPMLTKHIGVAGRLVGVAGQPTAASSLYSARPEAVADQHYRAGFVEVEGLYYPFGTTHRVRFALGVGGFTGYYNQQTTSEQVQTYQLVTRQGAATGYLGSLNMEVALGKERVWLVGFKAMRQQGQGASLTDLSRGITNLPGQSVTLARQL